MRRAHPPPEIPSHRQGEEGQMATDKDAWAQAGLIYE